MKLPSYNLHSHTTRCGHATGNDRDFVEAAAKAGYKELGFSDHIMLPSCPQEGIRGDFELFDDYCASVLQLKEEYKGRVDIHLGFEAEWYGRRFRSYYRSLVHRPDFEYLILGQHCYYEGGQLKWYAKLNRTDSLLRYRADILEGMRSGLFLYVAHPDLYVRWRGSFDYLAREVAEDIARTAEELRIPLEVNCGPLRWANENVFSEDTLMYPCPQFWEVVRQFDVDVVVGVDAHHPEDYETTPYDYVRQFVKKHGLRVLEKSPLTKK